MLAIMCSIALDIKGGMKATSSLECTRVGNNRLLTTKEIAQICTMVLFKLVSSLPKLPWI